MSYLGLFLCRKEILVYMASYPTRAVISNLFHLAALKAIKCSRHTISFLDVDKIHDAAGRRLKFPNWPSSKSPGTSADCPQHTSVWCTLVENPCTRVSSSKRPRSPEMVREVGPELIHSTISHLVMWMSCQWKQSARITFQWVTHSVNIQFWYDLYRDAFQDYLKINLNSNQFRFQYLDGCIGYQSILGVDK